MASHFPQRSADTGTDDPRVVSLFTGRGVPPIPEERLARIMGEPVDVWKALELAERERRAIKRKLFWQAVIEWGCVALMIGAALYFSIELMRPLVSGAAQ